MLRHQQKLLVSLMSLNTLTSPTSVIFSYKNEEKLLLVCVLSTAIKTKPHLRHGLKCDRLFNKKYEFWLIFSNCIKTLCGSYRVWQWWTPCHLNSTSFSWGTWTGSPEGGGGGWHHAMEQNQTERHCSSVGGPAELGFPVESLHCLLSFPWPFIL